jgi:hypothetical protein
MDQSMNSTSFLFENNYTHQTFNYTVCGKNFCPNTELPPTATPELAKVMKKIKIPYFYLP